LITDLYAISGRNQIFVCSQISGPFYCFFDRFCERCFVIWLGNDIPGKPVRPQNGIPDLFIFTSFAGNSRPVYQVRSLYFIAFICLFALLVEKFG
jgi:hypothetical protein